MTAEIYRFTSTRPRFPDPLNTTEQLNQLPLVTQFFDAAPKTVVLTSLADSQPLIWTLGAVHALANPLSGWQSFKKVFAFLGNRKGRLTPALSQLILSSIKSICAEDVTGTVKKNLLERSKQVKSGIRGVGGMKRFQGFGMLELATFAGSGTFRIADLTELCPLSKALVSDAVDAHVRTYHTDRKNTMDWEKHAKETITSMVNPVDE